MKLEDIIDSWEKDGPVDAINITNESANTPKLHNKYFKIYMGEGIHSSQDEGWLQEVI